MTNSLSNLLSSGSASTHKAFFSSIVAAEMLCPLPEQHRMKLSPPSCDANLQIRTDIAPQQTFRFMSNPKIEIEAKHKRKPERRKLIKSKTKHRIINSRARASTQMLRALLMKWRPREGTGLKFYPSNLSELTTKPRLKNHQYCYTQFE